MTPTSPTPCSTTTSGAITGRTCCAPPTAAGRRRRRPESTTLYRILQQRLETYRVKPELDDEQRRWILHMLTAAEGIEKLTKPPSR